MGFLDRLLGREKKADADVTEAPHMGREGAQAEAEGMGESRAEQAEDMAQDARTEAERRTERENP